MSKIDLQTVISRKESILQDITKLMQEYSSLSGPGTPAHFSSVLFMAMVQKGETPAADSKDVDVTRAISVKGSQENLEYMLASVFDQQPALFAIIQRAVVDHVGRNFDLDKVSDLLNKKS